MEIEEMIQYIMQQLPTFDICEIRKGYRSEPRTRKVIFCKRVDVDGWQEKINNLTEKEKIEALRTIYKENFAPLKTNN